MDDMIDRVKRLCQPPPDGDDALASSAAATRDSVRAGRAARRRPQPALARARRDLGDRAGPLPVGRPLASSDRAAGPPDRSLESEAAKSLELADALRARPGRPTARPATAPSMIQAASARQAQDVARRRRPSRGRPGTTPAGTAGRAPGRARSAGRGCPTASADRSRAARRWRRRAAPTAPTATAPGRGTGTLQLKCGAKGRTLGTPSAPTVSQTPEIGR